MSQGSQELDTDSPEFLEKPDGARLAYHKLEGRSPGIVFCGGLASDMTGTKAMALEEHAKQTGQAFLRFDYQGHGQSSGKFIDGTIGLWHSDALAVFDALTDGPQIVVGSSMGGWQMLLLARARPKQIAGLVGIAAAPDFTEDLMWNNFSDEIKETLRSEGVYYEPSEYSDEPYALTMNLIVEGRNRLLLRGDSLDINVPVRFLHGMSDADVPYEVSIKAADHLTSDDVEVRLIKGGDHRLSTDSNLAVLKETVAELSELAGA